MNLNTGSWASPLLQLVARLRSDGLNSATPVTEINGGTISATNADIALVAKGTGATLAQVPDGTTVGGNKRGTGATDWQKVRNAVTQVAGGASSVIAGGSNNTTSGLASVVGGGQNNSAINANATVIGGYNNTASGSGSVCGGFINTASSNYSFVGGGDYNIAQTNTHAAVCGGSSNTAGGQYSFVGGGQLGSASNTCAAVVGGSLNTSSGGNAFIGAGYNNAASSPQSTVCGGIYNTANGVDSFVAGGRRGTTRAIWGNHVFPACSAPIAETTGITQSALLLLARQTTDATATVLTSNTSAAFTNNQVILPNNAAYYFRGSVIAGVTAGGNSKAWTFEGAIKRGANAASTAIVGTVVLNTIAQDAGASSWAVAITADTTNGGIAVTVTGAASTTIRWVAKIETTEMTY